MIYFIGDKPSKKNTDKNVAFVGTRSYKTLLDWIYRMNLSINSICLFNHARFIETNNEWGFVVLPNNVDENIPLVLHFHGNGGYVNESGADWIDEPRKQKFFLPVLESGFAIAGCHGTGNHWGRQSSLDANYNFFEQLFSSEDNC